MLAGSQTDLEILDQALLGLRHFFGAPGVLDDRGRRVELSTLLVLDAIGSVGASVREVAQRLGVAHSTASRLVKRAEEAGMVARGHSTLDARETVVAATEAGRQLGRRALAFRLGRLVELTQDWSPDEVATFAASLRRFARVATG